MSNRININSHVNSNSSQSHSNSEYTTINYAAGSLAKNTAEKVSHVSRIVGDHATSRFAKSATDGLVRKAEDKIAAKMASSSNSIISAAGSKFDTGALGRISTDAAKGANKRIKTRKEAQQLKKTLYKRTTNPDMVLPKMSQTESAKLRKELAKKGTAQERLTVTSRFQSNQANKILKDRKAEFKAQKKDILKKRNARHAFRTAMMSQAVSSLTSNEETSAGVSELASKVADKALYAPIDTVRAIRRAKTLKPYKMQAKAYKAEFKAQKKELKLQKKESRMQLKAMSTEERKALKLQRKKALQKKRNQKIHDFANGFVRGMRNLPGNIANALNPKNIANAIKNAARKAAKMLAQQAVKMVTSFFIPVIIIAVIFIAIMIFVGSISGEQQATQMAMYQTPAATIAATDKIYEEMEDALKEVIDKTEELYPNYTDYWYYLNGSKTSKTAVEEEVKHDQYLLASYLSAKYVNYEGMDLNAELQEIFDELYDVEYTYSYENLHNTYPVYEGNGSPRIIGYYPDSKVLHVKVTKGDLDSILRSRLTDDQLEAYDVYVAYNGLSPEIFDDAKGEWAGYSGGNSTYSDTYKGTIVDLSDTSKYGDTLAKIMSDEEAAAIYNTGKSLIGTPYVWGGKSPSGFDCSGFVQYTLIHSGVVNESKIGSLPDNPRSAANIYANVCVPISSSEAKAGDLVFFSGTTSAPGITHVGIYLGNGLMMAAGKPVKIQSINTPYWQKCSPQFGRIKDSYKN